MYLMNKWNFTEFRFEIFFFSSHQIINSFDHTILGFRLKTDSIQNFVFHFMENILG